MAIQRLMFYPQECVSYDQGSNSEPDHRECYKPDRMLLYANQYERQTREGVECSKNKDAGPLYLGRRW